MQWLSQITYERDTLNRVIGVYDHETGQIPVDPDTWTTDPGAVATEFEYNNLGQLTTIERPNDVDTTYTYGDASVDVDGTRYQNPYQVYSIEHEDTEISANLGRFDYTYDGVGNRETMAVTTYGGSVTNISYDYDRAYRLVSESYDLIGGATTGNEYEYDRVGNRTVMRDASGNETRYSYNNNDELTRVDYLPDYIFEDYTYDDRGNLISTQLKQDGVSLVPIGNPTLYEYNAIGQMTRVELPTTERIDFEYAWNGNRVRMEIVGSQDPIVYLWDEFSCAGYLTPNLSYG